MKRHKATIKKAKELGANRFGWAGFKHNLLDFLKVSSNEFDTFDVPLDWKNAFLRANNRPQLKDIPK